MSSPSIESQFTLASAIAAYNESIDQMPDTQDLRPLLKAQYEYFARYQATVKQLGGLDYSAYEDRRSVTSDLAKLTAMIGDLTALCEKQQSLLSDAWMLNFMLCKYFLMGGD